MGEDDAGNGHQLITQTATIIVRKRNVPATIYYDVLMHRNFCS